MVEFWGVSVYMDGVAGDGCTPPTTYLLVDRYPDGDLPARPGNPQGKRNANRPKRHSITSMFESKAFAEAGVAYPHRRAGWRGACCFCP